jgi:hypothetical protein
MGESPSLLLNLGAELVVYVNERLGGISPRSIRLSVYDEWRTDTACTGDY